MHRDGRKVLAALAIGGGIGALVVGGFPRRSGLTAAQSLVSPLVEDLATAYADLWDVPLQTVYSVENELLVVETDEQVVGEDPDNVYWRASLAIRLVPGVDGTVTVQVRERYLPNGTSGKAAAYGSMVLSAYLVRKWLHSSHKHVEPATE